MYRGPDTIENGIGYLQESNQGLLDEQARKFTLLIRVRIRMGSADNNTNCCDKFMWNGISSWSDDS